MSAILRTLIESEEIPELSVPEPRIKTVPLTIICGFLGAGKSTLVRSVTFPV